MTKRRKLWIIGWTATCFVAAILSFFIRARYRLELCGESSALNYVQQKGVFRFENARNSFSIAHATQIIMREMDTVFAVSDYNVHFDARSIRFEEIRVSDNAQIRIAELNNSLVLSVSNVELRALFQLTGMRSISIRNNQNDAFVKISTLLPLETASVLAKKTAFDYQTSLYFSQGYTLRIRNLSASDLDFGQSIPGVGYRHSLHRLQVLNEPDKLYSTISTYNMAFTQIDELEITCDGGNLHFKIVGVAKKLQINGVDIRKSLYDHYVQSSGLAHLIAVLGWLIALLLPFGIQFLPQGKL